jgi:D-aminopeptidase
MYPNNYLSAVFQAAVQATEEAVVNAMVAAETVTGVAGFQVKGIPKEQLRAIFSQE